MSDALGIIQPGNADLATAMQTHGWYAYRIRTPIGQRRGHRKHPPQHIMSSPKTMR